MSFLVTLLMLLALSSQWAACMPTNSSASSDRRTTPEFYASPPFDPTFQPFYMTQNSLIAIRVGRRLVDDPIDLNAFEWSLAGEFGPALQHYENMLGALSIPDECVLQSTEGIRMRFSKHWIEDLARFESQYGPQFRYVDLYHTLQQLFKLMKDPDNLHGMAYDIFRRWSISSPWMLVGGGTLRWHPHEAIRATATVPSSLLLLGLLIKCWPQSTGESGNQYGNTTIFDPEISD